MSQKRTFLKPLRVEIYERCYRLLYVLLIATSLVTKSLTSIALAFLLCALTSLNSNAIELGSTELSLNLAPEVSVLKDSTGKLSYEQVKNIQIAGKFEPAMLNGNDINFGFTKDTYWLKWTLSKSNEAPSEWLLSIPYQTLDHIVFYAPNKKPVVTGNLEPFDSKPIPGRFFTFPIELSEKPQTFYLQVRSEYALTVPLTLWQPNAFFENTQSTTALQALYFGELITLILYNLLIYLSIKDKKFLLYSLFAMSMGLAMFSGNGFGRLYLWQNSPGWDEVSQCVFLSITTIFGILFTKYFLNTRSCTPKLNIALSLFLVGFVAIATLLPLSNHLGFGTSYLYLAFGLLIPIASITFIAVGWVALRSGQREARYFLLAWGTLWIGAFIAAFRAHGLLPSNTFTNYAVQISSALEMLLFSFALADRMRIERIKKEEAQLKALQAEHSLVKSLRDNEKNLELMVLNRTNQLNESLVIERKLNSQYSRFNSLISHEFRTPLNLIESQIALFKREVAQGIDNSPIRFTMLTGATHRLADLFERWVKGDRLNYALDRADPKNIAIDDWLPTIVANLQNYQKEHVLIYEEGTNATIFADGHLLQTALINLVDNACKYSSKHSTVKISIQRKPGMTGICVSDTGIGIDPQDQASIFDEYFRVNPNTGASGIGLGLAFVKKIANLHQGTIEIKSEVGQGSSFCLWFLNKPAEAPKPS